MKLTREQFINYVNKFEEMHKAEIVIADTLEITGEWKPMDWISEYYALLSDMCELPENRLYGTDLDWFCYDTDFGKMSQINEINVWDNGDLLFEYTIDSPEALWDYWVEQGIIE